MSHRSPVFPSALSQVQPTGSLQFDATPALELLRRGLPGRQYHIEIRIRNRRVDPEVMLEDEASVNIPSLLTLAVVSLFVIRWFLKRSGSSGPGDTGSRGSRNIVDPSQVEQIAQMFPQLSTRDIIWDLQRNGGSVAATTERILTGRGLDTPPPSFQPQIVLPSTATGPAAAATQPVSATAASSKPNRQDLISRYNLGSKIAGESAGESVEQAPSPTATSCWSQNKDERQRLLQKRRDDMILAARKKMMQKERNAQ